MADLEDTALVVIRAVVQMDLAVGLAMVMAATEGAMDAMAMEMVVMATMEVEMVVIFVATDTSLMGMVVAMVQALEEGVQTVATVDVEGLAGVTAAGDLINFI